MAAWVCEERIAVYEEKEKKTNEENQESGVRNVENQEKTNTGHCFCALSTLVARPADQVATLSEVAKKDGKNHQKEIERIIFFYKSVFRRRRKNWYDILIFVLS